MMALCDHKKVVLELLVSGWKGSVAFGPPAESSHPGRHRRSHIRAAKAVPDSGGSSQWLLQPGSAKESESV
jgi:hypothetical protein